MLTGIYEYGIADLLKPRTANGVPHLTKYRMRVEIISFGQTRTKIRFLEKHRDGRCAGTVSNVKSKNVTISAPKTCWYPYKDD